MMELYIIRHGIAEDQGVGADFDRALTKKGKEQMKDVGKGLKELDISFDSILTSPLVRAKETAEIIHDYCGNTKTVIVTDLLTPGSSYDRLIILLNKFNQSEKVALVGHEPFLSGFASYCLAHSDESMIHLKKGGVIKLEIDQMIKPGHCLLSWLMEPSQICRKR